MHTLREIKNALLRGEYIINQDDVRMMNQLAMDYISPYMYVLDLGEIQDLLEISNILYNNTCAVILPLDDGIYDAVVTKYNAQTGGMAPVGAPPVDIKNIYEMTKERNLEDEDYVIAPDVDLTESFLYYNDLSRSEPFDINDIFDPRVPVEYTSLNKIKKDTKHTYPELVGTLNKCKFVLINDARKAGRDENDDDVSIFEQYLASTYNIASSFAVQATGSPKVGMIAELKYDGVSVEIEVEGDTIVSAISRGDTANDIASDYTPIFGGKKFHRAKNIPKETRFGIKCEAIITNTNMRIMEEYFHKSYKNPRVAIIGILGSSDARKYRDLITLVPICTSGLQFADPVQEVNFLNKYYSSGVAMKYAYLYGEYYDLLWQVKRFTEEAEGMRNFLDFMYDGVVVSYTDPQVINYLGRINSVNQWSMAIKFDASYKDTVFEGYSFTVGQNGMVTPMAHFKPVEFLGTIHDKTTVHSYKRVKQLALRKGDIVRVTYVNDVICYLTKPYCEWNDQNPNPVEEFPERCPDCGSLLVESESQDTMYCMNLGCTGRLLARITNMLKKLGVKDFAEAMVKALELRSFRQLMTMEYEYASRIIGNIMATKLFEQIDKLKSEPIKDYKLAGALGFSSISSERWKMILNEIPLEVIINYDDERLGYMIENIRGMGSKVASVIIKERVYFIPDLMYINEMANVVHTYRGNNPGEEQKRTVRFTGYRSTDLERAFSDCGFDADGTKSVTKKTDILIVPYTGFQSSKTKKIGSECMVLNPDQAWAYIQSLKK